MAQCMLSAATDWDFACMDVVIVQTLQACIHVLHGQVDLALEVKVHTWQFKALLGYPCPGPQG